MNFIRKQSASRLFLTLLGAGIAATAVSPAFAGGLSSGTSAANTFYTWLYSFLGICAGSYLLYKGFLSWTDREQWSDFGMGVAKVAACGGVAILAPWAWSLFTS